MVMGDRGLAKKNAQVGQQQMETASADHLYASNEPCRRRRRGEEVDDHDAGQRRADDKIRYAHHASDS